MEQFLQIGIITSPHGVRGDERIFPTTDDPQRFLALSEVILRKGKTEEKHAIGQIRFSGRMILAHFSGIDDRDEAERYREWQIMIPREEGVPLEENEYYVADLIGMEVRTEDGALFGELTDVMQTGANDVYVIRSEEHGEVLLPAIKECIMKVEVEKNTMTVHLLPGII